MSTYQNLMWYAHGSDGDFGPFVSEADASAWVEKAGGEWKINPLTQTRQIMFLFWRNPPGASSEEARAFMRNLQTWNRSWFEKESNLP
ncbi:MAG: hypothetical protein OEM84_08285 [Acidimicrobiia bacterium]|nr:hypothetical protein [Acidimicrobiia bacterium]